MNWTNWTNETTYLHYYFMTSHIKYLCLFLCVSLLSWVYLIYNVRTNTPDFQADEMYWISTARIIPLLASKNTTDPFWREYYGYANFNGGKFIYGVGLWLFGYRDFTFAGSPPDTYYRYQSIQGKYPVDDPYYPILRDAREISATFAALAVGLMAVWVFIIFENIIPALLSAVVLIIHPIFLSFATIAFTDSFSLFFQMVFLVMLECYLRIKKGRTHLVLTILLGCCLAELTAIKMNGLLFGGVFVFYAIAKHKVFTSRDGWKAFMADLGIFTAAGVNMFLLLHPNFSFPGANGPLDVLEGRLRITAYQMSYWGKNNPQYVWWTIPDRVVGSFHILFSSSPLGFLMMLTGLLLLMRNFQIPYGVQLSKVSVSAFYIYDVILQYVVFNQARYLLPILPFLIAFSVYIFAMILRPQKAT